MNALFIICGLGVLTLIAEIANLKKWLIATLTLGIATAVAILNLEWNTSAYYFKGMIVIDNFSTAFTMLICVTAVFWFWMAGSYFRDKTHITDQAALILFAIVGAIIMTCFNNMVMLFLGIEMMSLSLYVLAGSRKENIFSNEAAFKYFLMGSFATGFLLMGIALIYGATGSFQINNIVFVTTSGVQLPSMLYAGILMIMVGMAFKISAVPFHFWAPDVYEGSPTIITAFMSTIVKVAAFAAFMRLFSFCFASTQESWILMLKIITVMTLVMANVTAVYQLNVKRMLAYSSVGHAGYLLLALVSGADATSVVLYYLAAYAVASLLAFSVLILHENNHETMDVKSFHGFFRRNPFLTIALIIALLSLAGIPPLAGFFGKYLVFSLALNDGHFGLVALAIITSLVGVYYYFKIIIAMFADSPGGSAIPLTISNRLLLWVLIILSFGMGIFPDLAGLL